MQLADYVSSTPDFPKPGILFRDFSPMLQDAGALALAVDQLIERVRPMAPDFILAPEARGFVFGPAIAVGVGAGFVPARKPGKLPPELIAQTYDLEYGQAELQLAPFRALAGARVAIHDDLLATGGTVDALAHLAARAGADVIGAVFLIELEALGGRAKLARHVPASSIETLLTY